MCGYTLGVVECHILFWVAVPLTSGLNSRKKIHVWSITPILFEVGIPNSVCGYTLGPGVSCTIFRSLWPWTLASIVKNHVRSISPILFNAGIPSPVCCYTLGSRSITYYWRVTVTLTLNSGLNSRKIVCGAYLLYHLRKESQSQCVDTLWGRGVSHTVFRSLCPKPLASNLEKSCLKLISYIIWGWNRKFGVRIHLGVLECHILFAGHCDLDLWPQC